MSGPPVIPTPTPLSLPSPASVNGQRGQPNAVRGISAVSGGVGGQQASLFPPTSSVQPANAASAPPLSSAPPAGTTVASFRRQKGTGGPAEASRPIANVIPTAMHSGNPQAAAGGVASGATGNPGAAAGTQAAGAGSQQVTATVSGGTRVGQPSYQPTSPSGTRRIDPAKVPCPAERWQKERVTFVTGAKGVVPPSVCNDNSFIVDDRNASPRFIRSTLYSVPATKDLFKKQCLPFVTLITPLGSPGPGEQEIPVVQAGAVPPAGPAQAAQAGGAASEQDGPVRCTRCAAYINHAVKWLSNGRQYQCSVCDFVNAVPEWYYAPILPTGQRTDVESRPELRCGSVDFVVGSKFTIAERNPPSPLCTLFLIDVSYRAQRTGATYAAAASIKAVLSKMQGGRQRYGVVAFAESVQLFNCAESLSTPQMIVTSDGSATPDGKAQVKVPWDALDGFSPYGARGALGTLLVAPDNANLHRILEAIEKGALFNASNAQQGVNLGLAVKTAISALSGMGGRLVPFVASLPSFGSSHLPDRQRAAATAGTLGGADERHLYSIDNNNVFYSDMCNALCKASVSFFPFIFSSNNYMDVGTFSYLAQQTGARVYYYNGYDISDPSNQAQAKRNSELLIKMREELRGAMSRRMGFDGVARIRCSKGISVTKVYGNFNNNRVFDELEMAVVDEANTITAELAVEDSKLSGDAVIQVATLYTTSEGERRIRVHTLALMTVADLNTVFRTSDLDSLVYYYAVLATRVAAEKGLKQARSEIAKKTGDVLFTYRKHCAKNPAPGQLILPEALKFLPAYVLGLLKSVLMRPGTDIRLDSRVFSHSRVASSPLRSMLMLMYPALYRLNFEAEDDADNSNAESNVGKPNAHGGVDLPRTLRLLRSQLTSTDVYMLDNGQMLYVWFGGATPPDKVSTLLGVDSLQSIAQYTAQNNTDLDSVVAWDAIAARGESEYGQRVNNIAGFSRMDRQLTVFKRVFLVLEGDHNEQVINTLLIEDAVSSSMSLTGFLRHLHTKISKR